MMIVQPFLLAGYKLSSSSVTSFFFGIVTSKKIHT